MTSADTKPTSLELLDRLIDAVEQGKAITVAEVFLARQHVIADILAAKPPPSDGERRYTLAEARQLLAERECAGRGHDLDQVRNGAGDSVAVFCGRCGLSFAPVDRHA